MKPTVIGNGDGGNTETPIVRKNTPTIIGPANASAQVKPTVMSSAEAEKASTQVVKKPENNFVKSPSIMPGSVRKRIPVTREDVKAKYQSLKESVIEMVVKIIEATNQNELNQVDVITWGQSLQENHNNLVSETLEILGSEVVQKSTGYINRMMEILSGIRLEKVFEQSTGLFAKVLRLATAEIDTEKSLDEALREIMQLSKLMRDCIGELVMLSEKLRGNSKTLVNLGDSIEASLIAALVVADYFKKTSQQDIAGRLEDRSNSLTVTLGQIRSGGLMRDDQIEQPMRITTLIQEVVFNTLPVWIESVAALRMRHGVTTNPTEISELGRSLKSLVNKLKTN